MVVRPQSLLAAFAVGLLTVLLTGSGTTPRASAEVYTCGSTSPDNYHGGYQQNTNAVNYIGSQVDIVNRYGAVCDTKTGQGNFTNAYGMIAGVNIFTGDPGWGQSGYIRWYNSCTYFFSQIEEDYPNTLPQTWYGSTCLTYGNTNTYQNTQVDGCACLHSNINGIKELGSTWNPKGTWLTPFSPQFEDETRYLESDIPGNGSARTNWSNLMGKRLSDNSWVAYPCNALTHVNDGSATRADGEKWWVSPDQTCPKFHTYTDTAG
jgi:hypothetical protein